MESLVVLIVILIEYVLFTVSDFTQLGCTLLFFDGVNLTSHISTELG